jgi:hypothetical protein
MHDRHPLGKILKEYHQGKLDRKQLEEKIFQLILERPRYYHLRTWDKDLLADFIGWLYPRIHHAIDRYKRTGASFDTYIGALLSWSFREYQARAENHGIVEDAVWGAHTRDLILQDQEPDYAEERPAAPQSLHYARPILMLLLKSYYFVSEDFATRAAPALGLSKEELLRLIGDIRRQRLKRESAVHDLRERIHCQYYRCISFEKRLQAAPEGSSREALLRIRLERGQKRLASMRKRLANIRLGASNSQIAQVLNVPKGTVDSSLAALKARMRRQDAGEGEDQGTSPN